MVGHNVLAGRPTQIAAVETAFRVADRTQRHALSGQADSQENDRSMWSRCRWPGHVASDSTCPAENVIWKKCYLKGYYTPDSAVQGPKD